MSETMDFRENFVQELFKINESNFNKKALALFNYQYTQNKVYKSYVDSLKRQPSSVQSILDIPFFPITFYQSEKIISENLDTEALFYSSGTTSKANRSKHYVHSLGLYKKVFTTLFTQNYGPINDCIVLALLPSYQENPDSSLLFMIDSLIEQSQSTLSGFISTDYTTFMNNLPAYRAAGKKIILFGVSYALLDLAERFAPNLSDFIVIETGGMKGRRTEMIKPELHASLKTSFSLTSLHSEYGMTELLSQAYATNDGIFECCPWMKVFIRKVNDPFDIQLSGRGGINIIDLANIDSCAFIEIQDLGYLHPDGNFEVLGRMDNTEQRGCNLLYS